MKLTESFIKVYASVLKEEKEFDEVRASTYNWSITINIDRKDLYNKDFEISELKKIIDELLPIKKDR